MRPGFLCCIISLLFGITTSSAQHCAYDNAVIIVINIHEQGNSENIKGLSITLVDSLGKPITSGYIRNGESQPDSLQFWQNTAARNTKNNETYRMFGTNFPFAKDNYILVMGNIMWRKELWVKIEDPSGTFNTPRFLIRLYPNDVYSLCGTYNKTEYQPRYYGDRTYKPVEIVLTKNKK